MTYRELDTVVLTRDLPDYGLRRGDVGAIATCTSRSFANCGTGA